MPRRVFSQQSWSIRSRVMLLLLAPLVPLIGMWLLGTTASLGPATNLLDVKSGVDMFGTPAYELVSELQAERALSMRLVSGGAGAATELDTQRAETDAALAEFRRLTGSDDAESAASALTRQHLAAVGKALEELPLGRAVVDTRQYDRVQIMRLYSDIIDRTFGLYGSVSGLDDHELNRQAGTVIALTEARELYARENALVSATIAGGGMSPAERAEVVALVGLQRRAHDTATRYLHPDDADRYTAILDSAAYLRLRAVEDRLADLGRPAPAIDATQWSADYAAVDGKLYELESAAASRTIDATMPAATAILLRLALAGGVGLIVIVVLVLVSRRVARSVIHRINALRTQALHVAEHSLPDVVARLRTGADVDVDAEVPPPPATVSDELDELENAFALVQRTAVASAVQEATLRNGLNQVFLNIGRRSQVLLHRQLALLDAMERRVTDPQDLEDLYRVDHLGARMRRHAEDLVILAGAKPGRGWRHPVPVHDVMRSAVSEVEEFTRITVVPPQELALRGRAVSDVIHLLAELLENATAYSPRDTHVTVAGQLLPNGYAVEIEDRGVGMPASAVDEANGRLADPPDFDPAHSSRLGLFVVARLAARHGIRVTLRPSPYGGLTAVVLLPRELVVDDNATAPPATPAVPAAVAVPIAALTAGPQSAQVVEGTSTPAAAAADDSGPQTEAELPVRAPQTHLAAPLRNEPLIVLDTAADSGSTPSARPAERTRSILTSLLAGAHRGRAAATVRTSPTPPAGTPAAAEPPEEPTS
ncbi:sensor histidine kinase [Catellatospora vulcania]|uniref:sensor histidine kinase n=1 Tax=Catellatospora vulcania TaxID=1460450 RepID=UPI0012D4332F|nr:nitrate- and nitrite sensing domain-containing protein [Catellatospora vulcania]